MEANLLKLDRLLEELAVALSRFETEDAFPSDWERPIRLDGVSLCALSDFPESASLPPGAADAEAPPYRGWMATVADPPAGSVVFARPTSAQAHPEAEHKLVSQVARDIFPGSQPEAHVVSPLRGFEGNPVFAVLTTHAPPDSLILSLQFALGDVPASVFFLCDGKRRREFEQSE